MFEGVLFRVDNLSMFVGIFVAVFSALVALYSVGFMRGRKGLLGYYLCVLLTFVSSLGVVFSNNLVVLMVFWGFLGLLLYILVGFGEKERTSYTAKKTFIIVGGTDALMLLGLAFIWQIAGSMEMDRIKIALSSRLAVPAYLCMAAGAFAKAGAMPFHTWVPDAAEDGPTPVTAFLPASLDKLLGIYFLARITLDMFKMDAAMNTFLMASGSVTIVAAVMMALIQRDMKRLLGYSTVSQVGYMVLGIGTGTIMGIAGGLFHMLNHAIYKSCLFLSAGVVEKEAGTTDMGNLGGYARVMPVAFAAFLIASLSVSGVPPFSGFASKWMVYQGVIETASSGRLWILWLIAAVFGSVLTLANSMKLVHAVFLGQSSAAARETRPERRITSVTMLIPMVILAALCVVFGVFASSVPLKMLIFPSLNITGIRPIGLWDPGMATGLLVLSVVAGFFIYLTGSGIKTRRAEIFVGGETLKECPRMRVSGTEFYDTVRNMPFLRTIYALAERKWFDVYEVGTKFTLGVNKVLGVLHNGVLPTYLAWCLAAMGILFYVLVR